MILKNTLHKILIKTRIRAYNFYHARTNQLSLCFQHSATTRALHRDNSKKLSTLDKNTTPKNKTELSRDDTNATVHLSHIRTDNEHTHSTNSSYTIQRPENDDDVRE